MIRFVVWSLLMMKQLGSGTYMTSNSSQRASSLYALGTIDDDESGPWGKLLEEWAIGEDDHRQMRIMKLPPTHGYYVSNRVDGPSGPYYDEWSNSMIPPPKPGKIINKPPPSAYPTGPYASKPYPGSPNPGRVPPPNRKEVSETDLYLLGAIEKLVYRVDHMEKRLKKAEEVIYYLKSGANKRSDPCPDNFARAGSICYHFSNVKQFDWKSSNSICKSLDAHLVELETQQENEELVSYIMASEDLRGKDFWTGGLNPGLLWIWSNSARPVDNGQTNDSQQLLNSPSNAPTSIKGNGRCLKLSYNPNLRSYSYFGSDCAAKQHIICERVDKTLSNEIRRLSKDIANSTVASTTIIP